MLGRTVNIRPDDIHMPGFIFNVVEFTSSSAELSATSRELS